MYKRQQQQNRILAGMEFSKDELFTFKGKDVLPAMGNELITLLKETSISGYIGLVDLTKRCV